MKSKMLRNAISDKGLICLLSFWFTLLYPQSAQTPNPKTQDVQVKKGQEWIRRGEEGTAKQYLRYRLLPSSSNP